MGKKLPSKRSDAVRNALVEEHLGVLATVVRHLWAGGKPMKALTQRLGDVDDVLSVGAMGLIRAAELWDPDIGPFEPYAYTCVRRTILAASAVAGVIHVPRLVAPEFKDHAYRARHQVPGDLLGENWPAPDDESESQPHVLLDAMAVAIAKMSKKDRKLIRQRLDGETCADIAASEHVTRSAIGVRLQKVYNRIRKVIRKPGTGLDTEW